jgi:hypothetical protein
VTQSSLEKQLKHYEVIDFDGLEGNNEQIYLKEDTQKLTDEAIQNMKTLEDNPEKLIETIAQNNANFQMRFAFSKQKYIDKKEKKHNLILKIERCSVANLNNFYISKHNDYAFTREDSLAFVLNSTYPENGDVVFINEKTRGVITAALLDRISEFENSKILLFNERSPSFDVLRYEAIKLLDLSELGLKKMRFIQKTQLSEVTEKINFVVIANDGHELEVLKSIDKLLAPNCKVMVFSRYYEVIKEIYEYLGSTKTFANLKFTDYFYRVYQALPMRSHPTMQGNTCSSFFLTAIRVNI